MVTCIYTHVRNLVGSKGTEAVKTQIQDRLKALSFAHQYPVTANLTGYDRVWCAKDRAFIFVQVQRRLNHVGQDIRQ